MRIFTAVPFPTAIKDQIRSLTASPLPSVRWEHADDFHITLRFIGEVDESRAEEYITALKTVQAFPFAITLQGVAKFPQEKPLDLRVLLVTLAPSRSLIKLQAAVSTVLEAAGLPKDKYEAYIPHVTIGRIKEAHPRILPPVTKFLKDNASFRIGSIPVTEFVLYESARQPNGAQYHEVMRFPLQGES